MKNKFYSKDEIRKRFIDTQTVILDTVTKQQSTKYIAHYKCSVIEASSPTAVPSPAQNSKIN